MENLTTSQLKAKQAQYKKIALEGGEGFNLYSNELEMRAEKAYGEMVEKRNAEWDLETTKARRAEFNLRKPTRVTLDAIQDELGYTMFALKAAIKKWGL